MNKSQFMQLLTNEIGQLESIDQCNCYTQQFGLSLTEQEARLLLTARKNILKQQERVEFGESVLSKLIFTFCDSPFIYQDNYADTIEALLEVFYLYKNESLDELSDDELLTYMKRSFDGICQGSVEYLADTCLEKFARDIRLGDLYQTPLRQEREDEDAL